MSERPSGIWSINYLEFQDFLRYQQVAEELSLQALSFAELQLSLAVQLAVAGLPVLAEPLAAAEQRVVAKLQVVVEQFVVAVLQVVAEPFAVAEPQVVQASLAVGAWEDCLSLVPVELVQRVQRVQLEQRALWERPELTQRRCCRSGCLIACRHRRGSSKACRAADR